MNEKLRTYIDRAEKIVFFGGAGTSTESGIPDFRSAQGLYSQKIKISPETILSRSFFDSNTEEFYDFYRKNMIYLEAEPNPAHRKLALLEKEGKLLGVITQNIDGLHQKAGSENVQELHGSVHRNNCMKCRKFYNVSFIMECEGVPKCSCGGIVKPDVVLYEEGLDSNVISQAVNLLQRADLLIVGGTSLNVYPAAGLLQYFEGEGCVVINMDTTAFDSKANLVIKEPIASVLY